MGDPDLERDLDLLGDDDLEPALEPEFLSGDAEKVMVSRSTLK